MLYFLNFPETFSDLSLINSSLHSQNHNQISENHFLYYPQKSYQAYLMN